jgi:hypothetical protein
VGHLHDQPDGLPDRGGEIFVLRFVTTADLDEMHGGSEHRHDCSFDEKWTVLCHSLDGALQDVLQGSYGGEEQSVKSDLKGWHTVDKWPHTTRYSAAIEEDHPAHPLQDNHCVQLRDL